MLRSQSDIVKRWYNSYARQKDLAHRKLHSVNLAMKSKQHAAAITGTNKRSEPEAAPFLR